MVKDKGDEEMVGTDTGSHVVAARRLVVDVLHSVLLDDVGV